MYFATSSREVYEKGSHEKGLWEAYDWKLKAVLGYQFREYFAGKAFPWDTREILCLEDF